MRIVFIGPPGVGKGTQCKRLAAHYQIVHLSTGEMLRSVDRESSLGQRIASYIDSGGLAPDDLVMQILKARLSAGDCRTGCLFDGVPRTLVQAHALDEHLLGMNAQIDVVVALEAETTALVDRLLKRAEQEHRADDNSEAIQHRLAVYREKTAPVLQYYSQRGLTESVDAMDSPDEVFRQICQRIDRRRS